MGKMKNRLLDLLEEAYWLGVSDRKMGLPKMKLRFNDKEIIESYNLGYEEGLNNE